MTFAELQKLAPAFDWDAYFQAAGLTPGDLNVAEPKFMQEVDPQLAATAARRLEDVPEMARAGLRGAFALGAVRRRGASRSTALPERRDAR